MKSLKDGLFESLKSNEISNSFYIVGGLIYHTSNHTGNSHGAFDKIDDSCSLGTGGLNGSTTVVGDVTWDCGDPGTDIDVLDWWRP